MHDIFFAESDTEIEATFPLMRQLRPDTVEQDYLPRVRALEWLTGYRLACLRTGEGDEARIAAVAGFRLSGSLAWGDFVYVDDLVCDEALRSSGYGTALLAWIADYARLRGCRELHLDSGVQRFAAHRFYLRERMDITCHHFRLKLE